MNTQKLARVARACLPVAALAVQCQTSWAQAQTPVAAKPAAQAMAVSQPKYDKVLVSRGRYLVQTAGCNDCHTPGYAQAEGKVDEKLWLTGDALGWRGPWGTSYAVNLRLYMAELTQEQWLKTARSMRPRPPMPWFNVHAMTDQDLKALYQYTRSIGPAGQPAPAWVAPDKLPAGPYIQFP